MRLILKDIQMKKRKILTFRRFLALCVLVPFLMFLFACLTQPGVSAPPTEVFANLVNGDFEKGLHGWKLNAPQIKMEGAEVDSRRVATIVMPESSAVGFPYLYQDVDVQPGQTLTVGLSISGKSLSDGHGAYCAVEFHDAAGKRLTASNVNTDPHKRGAMEWGEYKVRTVAPDKANTVRVCLVLHGHGTAYFDDVSLRRLEVSGNATQPKQATLQVTNEVVCQSFYGFGLEDDGQLHSKLNRSYGVDNGDYQLFERRIRWLDPHTVRMFCWHKDWCPNEDWKTFAFESPGMKSHYRALDLYQSLGTRVNLTGVELQMKTDLLDAPASDVAAAIGELFEYLIRRKGYTCIQDFTLQNEPDLIYTERGESLARYKSLHQLIKREFSRRKLDLSIVGSDEVASLAWFKDCVEDTGYHQTVDYFASHMYLQHKDRTLAPFFFDDRLSLLASQTNRKPFLVTEFGFRDERSNVIENPIMKNYPYAIWIADYCIEGLNKGVAGFSQFSAGSVYYPGPGLMDYSLWDFKDNGWAVRPVYHVWANFGRMSGAGDTVRKCASSEPQFVKGAFIGRTLFWVNLGDKSVNIDVQGVAGKKVRIMTEESLHGDRECGTIKRVKDSQFSAPPQSFGYVFEDPEIRSGR